MVAGSLLGAAGVPGETPSWRKIVLTDQYYCDGINTGDFNHDGTPDVVAGPFWYAGPDFKTATAFYSPHVFPTAPSPTDSMFSYVWDFNGDGWDDILVLGRVHLHQAFWYENPRGTPDNWRKHFAFHRVQGESPPFLDVDGDGRPELIAHWQDHWGFIRPNWKSPTEQWTFIPITKKGTWNQFYHGTGLGDLNGDGRPDLILNEGWWEQPADKTRQEWTEHPFLFSNDKGGAQMFAFDVDGDGDNDVVTALNAHGWGLAWFEQIEACGQITFTEHLIMGTREQESEFGVAFSQPHALEIADVNGDGLQDIVTGKRRWAHGPEGDVEPMAAPVNYWFELRRENGTAQFLPHLIDNESGLGVQTSVRDVNGDGRPDVMTASKLGAFLFLNEAP